jgi:hypothetical protein
MNDPHLLIRYFFFQRFTSHSTSLDLEHLSHLTRTLYHHDFALDILSLHLKISYLICDALEIISEYDCETVGVFATEAYEVRANNDP